MVPSLHELPPGCKFQDRCHAVSELCRRVEPELADLGAGHHARCHHPVAPAEAAP